MTAILSQPSASDLWVDAAQQLPNDVKQHINFNRPDKLNILDELREAAETSKQKSIESRWKFTRKSGETVIVRDLFEKIIRWVDTFKQIGDIAVQYDPVHASLPWAGIRFLLQIAVNDTQKFGIMIESLAWIAELMCRYKVTEALYAQTAGQSGDGLRRAVVKLYASILVYLSKANKYFGQKTAERAFRSVGFDATRIDSDMNEIRIAEADIDRWMALADRNESDCNQEKLLRLLAHMDLPLRRMDDRLRTIDDKLETSRRNSIVHWLSSEPYKKHHIQTSEDVLPGTGQWLLCDAVFKKWRDDSASSILWLHGIPGSGKSKLVSIVIQDALDSSVTGNSLQPVYFYCSRNAAEPARSDPRAILASLARQLSSLEPGLPLFRPLVDIYAQKEAEGFASGALQMKAICQLIAQLVELYPQTTIVLDALDECDPATRMDLMEFFARLLQDSSSLVKIFISSRDDQDIVWELSGYPNLAVDSRRNNDDIERFVNAEVDRLIKRRRLLRHSKTQTARVEMRNVIVSKVIEGAAGMFRWVSLQLQHLCSMPSDAGIRSSLGRLPPTLEQLYGEIYDILSTSPDEEVAMVFRNVLNWLLYAQQILYIDEFLAVVCMDPSRESNTDFATKDLVLEICNNFVVFDDQLETFRFTHLSVREFLESRPEHNASTANGLIARFCLWTVLSADDAPTTKAVLDRAGLHAKPPSTQSENKTYRSLPPWTTSETLCAYACNYWVAHSRLAGSKRESGTLGLILQHIFRNPSSFVLWVLQLLAYRDYPSDRKITEQLFDAMQLLDRVMLEGTRIENYVHQRKSAFSFYRPKYKYKEIESDVNGWFLVPSISRSARLCLCCNFDLEEQIDGIVGDMTQEEVYRNAIQDDWRLSSSLKLAVRRAVECGSYSSLARLIGRWPNVEVPQEIVEVAAGNSKYGKELITVLLEKKATKIVITETTMELAAKNKNGGKEIVLLLGNRLRQDTPITTSAMKAAVGNPSYGMEVILSVLGQPEADAVIDAEVLEAAAGNERYCSGLIILLLTRQPDLHPSAKTIEIAAGRETIKQEAISLLLSRKQPDISLSERTFAAAVTNSEFDCEMMLLLLKQQGAENSITGELADLIVRKYDEHVAAALLDLRGADVLITERFLEAAAQNGKYRKAVMLLLIRQFGIGAQVTVAQTTAIMGHFNKEAVALFLDKQGAEFLVTEKMVEAVLSNGNYGQQVMKLLVERRRSEVLKAFEQLTRYPIEAISARRVRIRASWGWVYLRTNGTGDSAVVQ